MKATNLNIFLQLGSELRRLCEHVQTGQEVAELWIYSMTAQQWLAAFLYETEPLQRQFKDSRTQIADLQDAISRIHTPRRLGEGPVRQEEASWLLNGVEEFEKAFDREHRSVGVYVVTPKGTRDTTLLIEAPESDLPEKVLPLLPEQFLYDLKQSARCLAFDIPTACAFHVCRATESLMLAYYEKLTGHGWAFKKRGWKIYVEQLTVKKAPKRITDRLDEIRDIDRNAYTHPDENVSLDEAKVLYTLCAGVNYYLCEELINLNP